MTFVFTPPQVASIRQRAGQVCCHLVLPSETIEADRTRQLRRAVRRHVEDGLDGYEETVVEKVMDVGYGGDLKPAVVTILLVEWVDVDAEKATPPLRIIDFDCARAAGFKTPGEMREEYRLRHPRAEFAKLAWFSLGDMRDKDRFLRRYVSRGGDYGPRADDTIDELPALSESQLEELAHSNRQKFVRQTSEQASALSESTLAQRVAVIEAVGDSMRREIREELRIITERTRRAQRKLSA